MLCWNVQDAQIPLAFQRLYRSFGIALFIHPTSKMIWYLYTIERQGWYHCVSRIRREKWLGVSYFLGNMIYNSTAAKLHTCILQIQWAVSTCALMAVKLTLNSNNLPYSAHTLPHCASHHGHRVRSEGPCLQSVVFGHVTCVFVLTWSYAVGTLEGSTRVTGARLAPRARTGGPSRMVQVGWLVELRARDSLLF